MGSGIFRKPVTKFGSPLSAPDGPFMLAALTACPSTPLRAGSEGMSWYEPHLHDGLPARKSPSLTARALLSKSATCWRQRKHGTRTACRNNSWQSFRSSRVSSSLSRGACRIRHRSTRRQSYLCRSRRSMLSCLCHSSCRTWHRYRRSMTSRPSPSSTTGLSRLFQPSRGDSMIALPWRQSSCHSTDTCPSRPARCSALERRACSELRFGPRTRRSGPGSGLTFYIS